MTDTKQINEVLQKYYEALYTPDVYPDPKALTDFFTNIDLPKLSFDRVKLLDGPVTETEIRKSVLGMKNGKSPGLDGFPVEYYRQFIHILAPVLEEVYNEAFVLQSLPPTFDEALITVIPKKDRDPL